MTASGTHVVFGVGQVGLAVVQQLADSGVPVRGVSRQVPPDLPVGVEWLQADVTYADDAVRAAAGASVIYQCLNAPYTEWAELLAPLQANVLVAAERSGAHLVAMENLYGYGPTHGKAMTEDMPLLATTAKGRTRAAMTEELLDASQAGRVRVTIGRASDFFGRGVTESTLGSRVFSTALGRKHAVFLGDAELPHTYSYVPDIAAGLIALGADPRSAGQVWHLPGPETVTTHAVFDLIAREVGHPLAVRTIPRLVLSALGLVNPIMRGLAEMSYQFDEPFVLDTSKYQATFSTPTTPLATAISDTVTWFRTQRTST